jgi:cation transport ATPase
VEKRIGEVPGVESVTVNYAAGSATVRYDETRLNIADIKSDVRQSGYESAAPVAAAGHKDHTAPGAPPAAPAPAAPKSAPDGQQDKAAQGAAASTTVAAAPKPSPVAAPMSASPKAAPDASPASAVLAGDGQKDKATTGKS